LARSRERDYIPIASSRTVSKKSEPGGARKEGNFVGKKRTEPWGHGGRGLEDIKTKARVEREKAWKAK